MVTKAMRIRLVLQYAIQLGHLQKKKEAVAMSKDKSIHTSNVKHMLGAFFKDFFEKRNKYKKQHEKKLESVKTTNLKKKVLERAIHMSDYVTEVEQLVKMNPVTKRNLVDAIDDDHPKPNEDHGAVILNRLESVNNKIIDMHKAETQKI